MKLLGNSRIALSYMIKKPLRTFLVLQGIIWAVAVAIFPHSVREGSITQGSRTPAEFGLDTITIHADGSRNKMFTMGDLNAIRKFPPEKVLNVAPARVVNGRFGSGDGSVTVQFIGTNEHSPDVRTFYARKGRYLDADDVKNKRRVCVLECKVAEKLFRKEDPLGKKMPATMNGEDFELEIIGVMEKRSEKRLNTNELGFRYRTKKKIVAKLSFVLGFEAYITEWKRTETGVHVPITLMPENTFSWIIVKTDPVKATRVAEELQSLLLKRGKLAKAFTNIVFPIMLENRLKIRDELTTAIFIVCLVLGGVMIMNIMLLSVIERYREIAIRRVEGAGKRDIVFQFLTEGAALCIIASILGIPLGLLMGYIAANAEPWAVASVGIPWSKLPLCIAWPVGIGLVSAILPARKAASLDPAEILRQK